jgi:hypothetical protein
MVYRTNDGIVLEVGRDDVIALGEKPVNNEVEGVGGVVAETEALGCVLVASEELSEALAKSIEEGAGFEG